MLTQEGPLLSTKARELREVFDTAFASTPPRPEGAMLALLLVRVAGELMAVARADLAGFARADELVPAPARAPAFLGLVASRGDLYPVWDLAVLLGRPSAPGGAAAKLLLARAAGGAPCALLCDACERMLAVPQASLVAPERRDAGARALLPLGSTVVPLIDVPALLAGLRPLQPHSTTEKPHP